MADYRQIDSSPLLQFLFYPRSQHTPCPENAFDYHVPVQEGISVFCRFFGNDTSLPWVLFFHGNGEIACDYDMIAPHYNVIGLNLVVADYRGYGPSGGKPSFTSMTRDAHVIYRSVRQTLKERGMRQDLWIMGRSLGSIAALELAGHYGGEARGLIIDSGFYCVTELIKHLKMPYTGVDLQPLEEKCLELVRNINLPALIIHGKLDQLVPMEQGVFLYERLGSQDKKIVAIRAGHNDIMFTGFKEYFQAISEFVSTR